MSRRRRDHQVHALTNRQRHHPRPKYTFFDWDEEAILDPNNALVLLPPSPVSPFTPQSLDIPAMDYSLFSPQNVPIPNYNDYMMVFNMARQAAQEQLFTSLEVSTTSGDGVGRTRFSFEMNQSRVKCPHCDRWFPNKQDLRDHAHETRVRCGRCGLGEMVPGCGMGGRYVLGCGVGGRHVLGCDLHGMCFDSEGQLYYHLLRYAHIRCLMPGCESLYGNGTWRVEEIWDHLGNHRVVV
jgi:hypothetical protein